jgi:hypothetical protein
LIALGYSEVRIKPHPGFPETIPYMEAVLRYFRLDARVVAGRLDEHVAWADVVVGPVNSGAFVETLSLGKPYYPCRGAPSALRPELMGAARVFATAAELRAALVAGDAPDAAAILDTLCSTQEIRDPARRVWREIERAMVPSTAVPVYTQR